MLSVFRPFFEVVKEGWILNPGLVAIPTTHHQFDFGLFWLILGHLLGLVKEKGWPQMICCEKSSKHIRGQSSNVIAFSEIKIIDFGLRIA
jgi:hypothetical protein